MISESLFDQSYDVNPFIEAAYPLLTLMNHLKDVEAPEDIGLFQQQVIQEFKDFDIFLQKYSLSSQVISAAKYCLCAAFDEAVLNTPWGTFSVWAQSNLLSHFYKETLGGERFFFILDHMNDNASFQEFCYVILSLGFKGKYYNKGSFAIDQIRHDLFKKLSPSKLSLLEDHASSPPPQSVPFLVYWAATLFLSFAFFLCAFALPHYQVYCQEQALNETMETLKN